MVKHCVYGSLCAVQRREGRSQLRDAHFRLPSVGCNALHGVFARVYGRFVCIGIGKRCRKSVVCSRMGDRQLRQPVGDLRELSRYGVTFRTFRRCHLLQPRFEVHKEPAKVGHDGGIDRLDADLRCVASGIHGPVRLRSPADVVLVVSAVLASPSRRVAVHRPTAASALRELRQHVPIRVPAALRHRALSRLRAALRVQALRSRATGSQQLHRIEIGIADDRRNGGAVSLLQPTGVDGIDENLMYSDGRPRLPGSTAVALVVQLARYWRIADRLPQLEHSLDRRGASVIDVARPLRTVAACLLRVPVWAGTTEIATGLALALLPVSDPNGKVAAVPVMLLGGFSGSCLTAEVCIVYSVG